MHLERVRVGCAAAICLLAGCVETYQGADIEGTAAPGVHVNPPRGGTADQPGQPPPGTRYEMYAVKHEYVRQRGKIVRDEDGNPMIANTAFFPILGGEFEIRTQVDIFSPCFIETERERFPGLHVSMIAQKLRTVIGVEDPLNPDDSENPNWTEQDLIDILTADKRVADLGAFTSSVRVLTSTSPAPPLPIGTECAVDNPAPYQNNTADAPQQWLAPPNNCLDDESAQVRLNVCRLYWDRHPDFYEGDDEVLVVPLNGTLHGFVTGPNPKNNVPLVGFNFRVPYTLDDIDGLAINYQFKDYDGTDGPDYPASFTESEKSAIGYHYMAGSARPVTRGTLNVELVNSSSPQINAEVTIFTNIGQDDVHF